MYKRDYVLVVMMSCFFGGLYAAQEARDSVVKGQEVYLEMQARAQQEQFLKNAQLMHKIDTGKLSAVRALVARGADVNGVTYKTLFDARTRYVSKKMLLGSIYI